MKKWKRSMKKFTAAFLAFAMALTPCITGVGTVLAADEPEGDSVKYQVTLKDAEHGKLKFKDGKESVQKFKEKETVELSVFPDEGYVLQKLTIQAEGTDEKIEDTASGDSYTFTMPAADLEVRADFKLKETKVKGDMLGDDEVYYFTEDTDYSKISRKDYEDIDWKKYGDKGIYKKDTKEFLENIGIEVGKDEDYGLTLENYYANKPQTLAEDDWQVGTVLHGSCYIDYSYMTGGQSYFGLNQFSGDLEGAEMIGEGWCADHTAAEPPAGHPVVEAYATITSLDTANGYVNASLIVVPEGVTDGSSNGNGLTGYQRIGANVRIAKAFNGSAKLTKSSANTVITSGNTCYSLAGAQYGVYRDPGCTNLAATLTTDASGNTAVIELAAGNYWVKETVAPKGYYKDNKVYPITVTTGQTALVNVSDVPMDDPAAIEIKKIDQETGDLSFQGSASLEGAQFTIKHYGGFYTKEEIEAGKPQQDGVNVRTWVLETKAIKLSNGNITYGCSLHPNYVVNGSDELYLNNGLATLPLGTISVEETKAPNGYLLEDAWLQAEGSSEKIEGMYVAQIKDSNDGAFLEGGNNYTMSDRVIRGDFELIKADEENQDRMANIPFKITSNTTGENHEFMTDENGYYSSESKFNKHSHDTNGGNADSGLWFGLNADGTNVEVNDEYGALPFDTYTIEELKCEANEDKVLFRGTLNVTRDGFTLDMGTIDNPDLTLRTKAVDEETGTHYSCADDEVTIVDTLSYTGLKKGKEYEAVGTLMNKETGKALLDKDGNPITASRTFEPATAEGEVDVTFTFDAANLQGADIVAFEEIRLDGKLVVEHKDINDKDQTIHFPDLGTKAADKDTNTNVSKADKEITIVDTVSYKNLQVGKKYTVKGTLMDKETGKAVLDAAGHKVTAETSFKAESTSGIVEVTFKFDGSNLAGETIVVFEDLYRGEKLLAVHADLEDKAQTVTIPKVTTTAVDAESETQNSMADKMITIVDTVSYENLIPGQEYTVKGTLMDASTGKPVVARTADTVNTEFEIPEGAVEVNFEKGTYVYVGTGNDEIPAGLYQKTEEGYILSNAREALKEIPDELITWSETFKDAATGYMKDGKLTLKPEMKPEYSEKEEKVTAEATFTAEKAEGKTEVTFRFDGSKYAGHTFVVFEELFMNEKSVAEHKDLKDAGQTIYVPEIKTTAKDAETGTQNSLADKEVTIVDTVSYKNLIPGKEYKVTGKLYDKETKEPLKVNDKEVTAETTFTPEKPDGKVEVTFKFDGSALQGKTIVVFENLYINEKEVAVHADIEDKDQSIYFPALKTTATDKDDSDKKAYADNKVTIVDEVSYSNLVPGETYAVVGTLMDKSTGKALIINEKEVTATKTFTAEKGNGKVSVEFTFDGRKLGGKDVVVFEKLYDVNGVEVGNHEDIKDEGQTVKLVTPPKPTVKTGDMPWMYVLVAVGGALAGAGVYFIRKKKKK